MKRFIVLGSFVLMLFSLASAQACSSFPIPMLQLVELGSTNHIISFRVTDYEADAQGVPNYMDGEITKQWRGSIEETSLRIYGGDGLACIPYVSEFAIGEEWLLPLNESDGVFRLSPFTHKVAIDNNLVTGFLSTIKCPSDESGSRNCSNMTPEQYTVVNSEQMTLEEFERALQIHSDGVAWVLQACEGPFTRCSNVRPSYNPENGVLELPGVDVMATHYTYSVSATLQLKEGTDATFDVIEIE